MRDWQSTFSKPTMEITWEQLQQDLDAMSSSNSHFPYVKSTDLETAHQESNESADKKDMDYAEIASLYQNYSLEDISREISKLSSQDEEKRQQLFDIITKKFYIPFKELNEWSQQTQTTITKMEPQLQSMSESTRKLLDILANKQVS